MKTGLDSFCASHASVATTATLTGAGSRSRAASSSRVSRCSTTTPHLMRRHGDNTRFWEPGSTARLCSAKMTSFSSAAAVSRLRRNELRRDARSMRSAALHGSAPAASAASSRRRRTCAQRPTTRRVSARRGNRATQAIIVAPPDSHAGEPAGAHGHENRSRSPGRRAADRLASRGSCRSSSSLSGWLERANAAMRSTMHHPPLAVVHDGLAASSAPAGTGSVCSLVMGCSRG